MRHFRLLLIVSFLSGPSAFATKGNDLRIGIIQEWSTFNPVTSQLASNEALFPFILRKMIRRSPDGGVVMDVAESVSALKNESGKFKALWKIRADAKWGNGKTITCADWKLGWQVGLNPKTSVESRSTYGKIEDIRWDSKSPQLCSVIYSGNDWTYDRDLPPLLPESLEKSVFEKHKDEPEGYDRNSTYISQPLNPGLYNGPYVISEFKLGSHFVLTRNPHFFGKRPAIERVTVKLIADTGALKANLLADQINAVSAVGFPPDTALLFDDEFKKRNADLKVYFQSSSIFQGIYFNLENELFKDAKVREALSRSVDKDAIVKAFFNSKLLPAEGVLAPKHPAYKKREKIFSMRTAEKLLDEAGWKSKNGVREKNGKKLQVTFKTSAGLKVLENIQVFVCDSFKKIGVLCNIKNESPRALLGQSVPHGEFDLAMFGQPIPPEASITSYFSSKEIPNAQNSWAGGNQIRLNSGEIDRLLSDFDKESSPEKRHRIAAKIEAVLMQNYFLIPIYHRSEAIVVPKSLKGLTDSYEGTAFSTPENWSL